MKNGSEIKNYEEQFSNFVESAAHDLHAPLRKLSVLIERVFEKNFVLLEGDTKEYVNRIENCIHEMQCLINGLTELARAGSNTSFDVCELDSITKQAIDALQQDNDDKQISIELESLPIVKGNRTQYQQLFKNLLENAVKFRRENTPIHIEIKTNPANDEEKKLLRLPNGKKFYKIEIRDNGIGFSQDNAEKIFEPFIRLHPKSKYEGNGLGLSICRKIAENHHGAIYARAKENEGACFTLILPETP